MVAIPVVEALRVSNRLWGLFITWHMG